ncbi:MAG TPA: hypothetical protein VIG06_29905 [Kofleriaceae bacterium]|jgi:TolA-binding protein
MTTRDRENVGLDELLETARADEPSPEQLARLDARLAPFLIPPGGGGGGGGGAAGGAASGGAAAAGGTALGKWLLAGVAAAGLGAGGYAVYRRAGHETSSTARAVEADAAPVVAEAIRADASPPALEAPDAAPRPAQTPRPERPPGDALAAEARLLERAQTALRDGSPAAALRAVAAHAKQFPRGALAEERERLAVEALLALDRRHDAEARARRFHREFPRSVQWQRIRDLLDAPR